MTNKRVYVLGGGTINHVRNHLALCAPAYGATARVLTDLCVRKLGLTMDVVQILTRMAGGSSKMETNLDVARQVSDLVSSNLTKIVFFNVALCDFEGSVGSLLSGKHARRLKSREGLQTMQLSPAAKLLGQFRKTRKDIFLVGFKTTTAATKAEQFAAGLNLLKESSANLILANDTVTRSNMIITPEEGCYDFNQDRFGALMKLVDMAYYRSHLAFTRSTVVAGDPVAWSSDQVFPALREVVDWCVDQGAYKRFRGVTTGHFAQKLRPGEFLTSIRKTDFNDLKSNGLVRVRTAGDDSVISYGVKPSVGGQSQRIIFDNNQDMDCIVHFHCPLREDARDDVQTVSQWQYECGSHECGQNTNQGLRQHGNLKAVYLENHGPNIVFSKDIDPREVTDFIYANFDMSRPTSGFTEVYL